MDLEREKGITIKARAVRLEYTAARRPHLRPQPHRHARPRRLRVRGQPQPAGVRGRDPRRRRRPGHRGPDAGQRPPRAARGPDDHPGHQQDRPAVRPARRRHGGARERPRDPARGGDPRVAPRRGPASPEILEAIVARIPPPKGDPTAPLRALVFDSHYDPYKGVVCYLRLAEGTLHEPRRHPAHGERRRGRAPRAGRVPAAARAGQALVAGEVGYVATGLKNVREAQVGDTVTTVAKPATEPLPGYQEAKSLVFAGLYPLSGPDYPLLRDALEKLHLNDASFTYEPEIVGRARASGSGAGSSACSTWRSSRSASSASSTSTSSRPRRRSSTACS